MIGPSLQLDPKIETFPGSSAALLKSLAHPERWRWLTRWNSPSTSQIHNPKHLQWMRTHTHQHEIREMLVSLEGTHFFGVRGKIYRAEPITVFLFDHSEPHDSWYSPFQPDCADLFLGIFNKRVFARHVRVHNGAVHINRRFRDLDAPLTEYLIEAWDVCSKTTPDPFALAKLRAAATLVIFQMLSKAIPFNVNLPENPLHKTMMTHITLYIRDHLKEDLSLKLLAQVAGYNPHYFHCLFKRYFGTTLHAYVNQERLIQAKELLSQGIQVQAIAELLGFANPAYFSRFFSKATGKAPIVWQQKIQSNQIG